MEKREEGVGVEKYFDFDGQIDTGHRGRGRERERERDKGWG